MQDLNTVFSLHIKQTFITNDEFDALINKSSSVKVCTTTDMVFFRVDTGLIKYTPNDYQICGGGEREPTAYFYPNNELSKIEGGLDVIKSKANNGLSSYLLRSFINQMLPLHKIGIVSDVFIKQLEDIRKKQTKVEDKKHEQSELSLIKRKIKKLGKHKVQEIIDNL